MLSRVSFLEKVSEVLKVDCVNVSGVVVDGGELSSEERAAWIRAKE